MVVFIVILITAIYKIQKGSSVNGTMVLLALCYDYLGHKHVTLTTRNNVHDAHR